MHTGARVQSKSDPTYVGVTDGVSEYEGGVYVQWDNGQRYPCSIDGLVYLDGPAFQWLSVVMWIAVGPGISLLSWMFAYNVESIAYHMISWAVATVTWGAFTLLRKDH